jgi:hypothetical protein
MTVTRRAADVSDMPTYPVIKAFCFMGCQDVGQRELYRLARPGVGQLATNPALLLPVLLALPPQHDKAGGAHGVRGTKSEVQIVWTYSASELLNKAAGAEQPTQCHLVELCSIPLCCRNLDNMAAHCVLVLADLGW